MSVAASTADPGALERTFDLDSPGLHVELASFEAHVRRVMARGGATSIVTAVRDDGRRRHVTVVLAHAPAASAGDADTLTTAVPAVPGATPERAAPDGLRPPAGKGAGLRGR